jgi:hypothetical protein
MNTAYLTPLLNRAAGRLRLPLTALALLRLPARWCGFAALAMLLGAPLAAVAAPGDVDL